MEMGFCMATLGVTQAGQEEPTELELEEEEETDAQEINESMDADQDPEVHRYIIFPSSFILV